MRRSRLLRQQPCSREIARQHIGAHPQFYLAILEGKATARIDRSCEHRGGITALTGIGDGTADQFAIADKDHIGRLTDPAVPARRAADAPLPHLRIGLGTVLQVKLVTEHQLIAWFRLTPFRLGKGAHDQQQYGGNGRHDPYFFHHSVLALSCSPASTSHHKRPTKQSDAKVMDSAQLCKQSARKPVSSSRFLFLTKKYWHYQE